MINKEFCLHFVKLRYLNLHWLRSWHSFIAKLILYFPLLSCSNGSLPDIQPHHLKRGAFSYVSWPPCHCDGESHFDNRDSCLLKTKQASISIQILRPWEKFLSCYFDTFHFQVRNWETLIKKTPVGVTLLLNSDQTVLNMTWINF